MLLAYAKVLENTSERREKGRDRERKGAVAVVNNPLPERKKESFHLSGR